jgi:serine protease AprX
MLAHPKLAPDVPNKGGSTVLDVIVQFIHPPTKDDLKLLGPYGQIKKQWIVLNAVHVPLTLDQIQSIQGNPDVAYITPNRPTTGSLDITTQAVKANLAWSLGWTGAGVGVAVIDSGIAQRPDLTDATGVNSRVVYEQSFVSSQTALDDYGHGTHVAGIIGSSGLDSTGSGFTRTYKGVAPGVSLIDLRVLDQNGSGYDADVISAIETAISLKNAYNIRVLNLSLGRPVYESYTLDPICQAVEAAWQAGIVVVTAAGNYGRNNTYLTKGYGTIASPGNDPYVITVGATNAKHTAFTWDDTIASYSSKGPTAVDHIVKPDIVAPGNSVTSLLAGTNCTLYTNYPSTHLNDNTYETGVPGTSTDYFTLSGTSMATPVVSGAAALLLQKTPSLSPDQVKERLMRSAAKFLPPSMMAFDFFTGAIFNSQSDIFTVGAGYLDVNAALANTDLISGSALSPTANYDPATRHVTIDNLVWGADLDLGVVWGDTQIYGPSMFTGVLVASKNVVWGADLDLGVVWGDSTNQAFGTVWGSSVVWVTTPLTATASDDSDQ